MCDFVTMAATWTFIRPQLKQSMRECFKIIAGEKEKREEKKPNPQQNQYHNSEQCSVEETTVLLVVPANQMGEIK